MNKKINKFVYFVAMVLLGRGMYGFGRYTARQEEIKRLADLRLGMRDIYIEVLENKLKEDKKEEL